MAQKKTHTNEQWLTQKEVITAFAIPVRKLREYTSLGYVRFVKHCPAKNCKTLYKLEDLEDLYTALSQGREPQRKGER